MAKKYDDKVPRKQKKEIKKKAGLQGQSVPTTEIVNLANKEAQKERRKQQAAKRYNDNVSLLESVGLPPTIITKRTSKKETQRIVDEHKRQQKAERSRLQKQALYNSKLQRLIDAGFSETEAAGYVGTYSHQISNAKIDEIIAKKKEGEKPAINDRIKLVSSIWLYVGYAETNHDIDFQSFANFTTDELQDLIRMRMNEVTFDPAGSDAMTGVFKVASGPKEYVEEVARDYYKRDYNFRMGKGHAKLDRNRYFKLTLSNRFNMHEFLQMVAQVICNAKNDMVPHYFDEFNIYCQESNFPFMDDL